MVSKIACGGLHTLALTNEGQIYSWGCNDDGALGRSGTESKPELITELPIAVSDIGAGDSHSIGYNKELGVIYLWGRYRNVRHGNFMDIIKTPMRIGEFEFHRKTIQKVVCGSHHTLFLVDGKVSAVGEPENENLGRLVLDRHKKDKALGLRIERVHHDKKKYTDIFAGNYHSFAVKEDGKLYAWGLNNYGQLGIGDYKNTGTMKEVQVIDGSQVVNIVGGENHTIALTKNGDVYSWGKNDESQLGYKIEEEKKMEDIKASTNEVKDDQAKEKEIPNSNKGKEEEKVIKSEKQSTEKMKVDDTKIAKTPEELAAQLGEEGDPENCSPIPRRIEGLKNIKKISAGTHYTYALSQESVLYSW